MKIQRRPSAGPKLFRKNLIKYLIGIAFGGLLSFSIFVVKDFFFYHLRKIEGHIVKETIRDIVCDSKRWHETDVQVERVFSKESVPKWKLLMYEALCVLWLYNRSEKIIVSIMLGGTIGALFVMATQHINPRRLAILPP